MSRGGRPASSSRRAGLVGRCRTDPLFPLPPFPATVMRAHAGRGSQKPDGGWDAEGLHSSMRELGGRLANRGEQG